VGGLGAASLIAGGVFVSVTKQDASRGSSLSGNLGATGCPQAGGCQDLHNAHDDQLRDYTLSIVFLTGGAIAAATGATLFFWPQHKESSLAVVPIVSPFSAGLQVSGEL
jgi:hypothetical protein